MNTFQALALFFLATPACAADWEYVTATGSSNVYADLDSVKTRTGKTKSARFLFDHLDTRYDTESARVYKSSIHLIEVDCTTKQLEWSRIEMYAGPLATGAKTGARNTGNQPANFMESLQSSSREAMANSICEPS
ncbi:MAG: surface-adhesin E family protein [Burkholderiales bacterium]